MPVHTLHRLAILRRTLQPSAVGFEPRCTGERETNVGEASLGDQAIKSVVESKSTASVFQSNKDIDVDVVHIVRVG